MLEAYLSGSYFHWNKRCTLRIDNNGIITSQNTPMGYITEIEDEYGMYKTFMILTLQNFKSQSNWSKQKMQLALAANKQDIMVLFVLHVDIFMNYENNDSNVQSSGTLSYKTINETFKDLIKVAKYSQADIKTSAVVYLNDDSNVHQELYSYNQRIGYNYISAEEVLCKYCQCVQSLPECFICLLEPCINSLKDMIYLGTEEIYYGQMHEYKYNTPEYFEYTNEIFNKTIKSYRNRPIVFRLIHDKNVDKFYNKEAK